MKSERNKNLTAGIIVLLILSIIPLSLFFSRDTVAEMVFPVEAVIDASPVLNIRSTPDTNNPKIGSIPYGEQVLLLEEVQGQAISGDTRWYRIDYQNQDGYVSAQYIRIQAWEPEFPPGERDTDFEQTLINAGFPLSYVPKLHDLHQKYPNWRFTPIFVNTDYESALNNQYRPEGAINLIPASSPDSFKSRASRDFDKETNTWFQYEPGWVAASREIIAYYLDPRNFLDESSIFMFESLSYNPEVQTWEGARNMLRNTFMDTDEYTNIFMNAAEHSRVSPYHLIARSKIEVGSQGSGATTGTYPGVEGYYNFFSIGAYGSTTDPLRNGLIFARDGYLRNPAKREAMFLPWTSPEKAIMGGAVFLGSDYINNLQNTVYLQKFDLLHNLGYLHQYMGNVLAPIHESGTTYTGYMNQGTLAEAKEFLIPVFAAIPDMQAPYPVESSGTPNNWLRSLYLDDALLPGFQTSNYRYQLNIKAPNNKITFRATAYNPYAAIDGLGTYTLKNGENAIIITVTATNGEQRYYEIIVHYEGETQKEYAKLQSDKLQIQPNGFVYGIDESQKLHLVEEILANVYATDNTTISIADKAGKAKTSGAVATGDQILQKDGNQIVGTYTLIRFGDVNGDAMIDILDVDSSMRYISGYLDLSDAQISAANVVQDAELNVLDVDQLARYISGYVEISPNLNPIIE